MEMEIIQLIATFLIGIFASFIGAMVGSAGLVTIPFLIFLGIPPHVAIATHKFGAIGLKIGALTKFGKADLIKKNYLLPFSLIGIVSAFLGAQILLRIDKELLSNIVVVLLLVILPVLFVKKDIGIVHQTTSKLKQRIGYLFYFLAMVFSAFFGGGSGTIVLYVFMYFFGFTIVQASATAMIPSLVLNFIVLVIFALNGIIDYAVGLTLFLGMLIGGRLGASTAINKGNTWVKSLFALVVIVLVIKIIMK